MLPPGSHKIRQKGLSRKKCKSHLTRAWAAFMAKRISAASVLAVSSSLAAIRSNPKRRLAFPFLASTALRSQASWYICRFCFLSASPVFGRPRLDLSDGCLFPCSTPDLPGSGKSYRQELLWGNSRISGNNPPPPQSGRSPR